MKLRSALAALVLLPLVLAAPANADAAQDKAYLQELTRSGFTGDASTVHTAQATCQSMDKAKAEGRWPLMAGLDMTFVNIATADWKVRDIFVVTGVAIKTFCPQYMNDFYAEVGKWRIQLP